MKEDLDIDKEKKPKEVVKELISQYIQSKPKRISLKLYWDDKRSTISINGDNLNQIIEHRQTIDFTSFAHGVVLLFFYYFCSGRMYVLSYFIPIFTFSMRSLNIISITRHRLAMDSGVSILSSCAPPQVHPPTAP